MIMRGRIELRLDSALNPGGPADEMTARRWKTRHGPTKSVVKVMRRRYETTKREERESEGYLCT